MLRRSATLCREFRRNERCFRIGIYSNWKNKFCGWRFVLILGMNSKVRKCFVALRLFVDSSVGTKDVLGLEFILILYKFCGWRFVLILGMNSEVRKCFVALRLVVESSVGANDVLGLEFVIIEKLKSWMKIFWFGSLKRENWFFFLADLLIR